MSDYCELKRANGVDGHLCDNDACVYWRVAEHLGVAETASGCAIQHFELLDGGDDLARWLLSVKSRVERPVADA